VIVIVFIRLPLALGKAHELAGLPSAERVLTP
jgi:hypothetical protein